MNLPTQLKIGGHQFKVVIQMEDDGLLDDMDCGECNLKTNTIYINGGLSQTTQEQTLIHEILHAINWQLDEELVESLAEQLFQVLHDNATITWKK